MQTRHKTYQHAAVEAWPLGKKHVQIIASMSNPEAGRFNPEPVFFLETDDDQGMVRSWERICYSGPGNGAPTSDPSA